MNQNATTELQSMLYPYQSEVVEFMLKGNCINACEPGTGKTIMSIALLQALNCPLALIITPKSVLNQFKAEILRFAPHINPLVITGTPIERQRLWAKVQTDSTQKTILITYETLRIDIKELLKLPIEVIIFDECHRLATTTTKLHKSVRILVKSLGQISPQLRLYGLTGTPLMNTPLDLYGIYNILVPRLFPNWFAFINKYLYRNSYGWILGVRKENIPELQATIKPYYIKKTLKDVRDDMPKHTEQIIKFALSDKEQKLYDKIRKELILQILEGEISKIAHPSSLQNSLVKLQKLQELTDHPLLIGESITHSSKFETLKELLDDTLTGNTYKAVVYSRFSRVIELLKPFLAEYKPVTLIGSDDQATRTQNIGIFKGNSDCRLMLMTTAGSEGVSLEEANYIFRLDTPFSIGRDTQLTGRIRRVNSELPTFGYTLCAEKTIDEKILKILARKKEINDEIFNLEDIKEILINN